MTRYTPVDVDTGDRLHVAYTRMADAFSWGDGVCAHYGGDYRVVDDNGTVIPRSRMGQRKDVAA